mmetsp:Transcript_59454/g.89666  ORF Transcript_59454/g.89666 Transcript_59454/m.89666 type:complete len:80 (-) Transcript_59454:177-416(-)
MSNNFGVTPSCMYRRPDAPGSTPVSNIPIKTFLPLYSGYFETKSKDCVSFLGTKSMAGNGDDDEDMFHVYIQIFQLNNG